MNNLKYANGVKIGKPRREDYRIVKDFCRRHGIANEAEAIIKRIADPKAYQVGRFHNMKDFRDKHKNTKFKQHIINTENGRFRLFVYEREFMSFSLNSLALSGSQKEFCAKYVRLEE